MACPTVLKRYFTAASSAMLMHVTSLPGIHQRQISTQDQWVVHQTLPINASPLWLRNLPVGDGTGSIRTLKARSVIVDMECGVINEMLKGPLGDVLDTQMMISDVSGAGTNWAHGNHV